MIRSEVVSDTRCGEPPKVGKKAFPQALVESVRHCYFDQEMTIVEVAAALDIGVSTIVTLMRNYQLQARVAKKRDQSGPKHHGWKGNDAGYNAMHVRVRAARGTPKECSWCGTTDQDVLYDWVNVTGNYADLDDYVRLCRRCHLGWDAQRRATTGKSTSAWNGLSSTGMPVEGFQSPV